MTGALGQFAVHGDQILHTADFARQGDLPMRHAHFLRQSSGLERRSDHGLVHHLFGIPGLGACAVQVHQTGEQLLVQAAPVNADTHGLVPAHGRFNHQTELAVVLVALADIAGVDAVFGQCLRAARVVGQQTVAVVMKVADQRHVDAHAIELVAHMRDGLGSLGCVNGDADQFGAGKGKLFDLNGGADDIDRVGVGH